MKSTFCLVGLMVLGLPSFVYGEDADAEKTLKSFGDCMVGGIWRTTKDGVEITNKYSWFADDKFLRISVTVDGEPGDNLYVIGVDPKTEKVTRWGFSSNGVRVFTLTQESEGVWHERIAFTTADRQEISWIGEFDRVEPDEYRFKLIQLFVDGEKVEPEAVRVWKRHR